MKKIQVIGMTSGAFHEKRYYRESNVAHTSSVLLKISCEQN